MQALYKRLIISVVKNMLFSCLG